MNDEQAIKELQKQINMLSSEMADHRQRLFALQQELNRLQNKKPATASSTTEGSSQNFRFENFIGLRVIHFVGIILLVIGLSIGVKYVIDRQLISEVMRISLAYAAGIILYLLSWRSKKNYQLFSAILFSGAMASLYFTTYAAFVYYGFFSFAVTFLLMVGLTVYTAFESIRYDRQEIAGHRDIDEGPAGEHRHAGHRREGRAREGRDVVRLGLLRRPSILRLS